MSGHHARPHSLRGNAAAMMAQGPPRRPPGGLWAQAGDGRGSLGPRTWFAPPLEAARGRLREILSTTAPLQRQSWRCPPPPADATTGLLPGLTDMTTWRDVIAQPRAVEPGRFGPQLHKRRGRLRLLLL